MTHSNWIWMRGLCEIKSNAKQRQQQQSPFDIVIIKKVKRNYYVLHYRLQTTHHNKQYIKITTIFTDMSCCGLLQLHSNLCCCCEKKMEKNERKKEIFKKKIRRSKEKYTVSTKFIHFFVRMWCYFYSEFCSGSITCWRFRRVKSTTTHKLRHWWWPHYAKRQNSKKTKPKKNLLSNVTLECHRCPCLRFHRYPHRWHQSADGNLVMVGDDVHEIEREMNWQKLKIVNIAGASIETESKHKTARHANA